MSRKGDSEAKNHEARGMRDYQENRRKRGHTRWCARNEGGVNEAGKDNYRSRQRNALQLAPQLSPRSLVPPTFQQEVLPRLRTPALTQSLRRGRSKCLADCKPCLSGMLQPLSMGQRTVNQSEPTGGGAKSYGNTCCAGRKTG
jgi:hypothetical protein